MGADRVGTDSWVYDYWARHLGTRRVGSEDLRNLSPAPLADQVKASVLLIHGRDDTVVAIKRSKIMRKALEKAGKEVQFMELKGEDHWLWSEETRIETLTSVVQFLERQLAPSMDR